MIKKAILAIFLFLIPIIFCAGVTYAQQSNSSLVEAQVLKITLTGTKNKQTNAEIKNVTLKILTGSQTNSIINVSDNELPTPYQLEYKTGDHVILTVSKGPDNKDIYFISDVDRKPMLLLLFAIFILLVILVGRIQGITSIIGMTSSFYIILQIIIPNIVAGSDPLVSVFIGAFLIIPITYYLAHGFNKKTNIAIFGTFLTLIFVGALSYGFTVLTKLTGFSTEEAVYLQNTSLTSHIDIRSLLLAGIIIGALAVLNDITISQASIVESLYASNMKLPFWELYSHTMKVGRDHIASLVNTLILVYVGASFPLVILFYNNPLPFGLILNQEIIATEIVRTLVTSIGIVAAVPITTYLACIFISRE